MKFLLRGLSGLMLSAAMVAAAQPFPEQNIDLIVPFSPGGGSDNLVRAMQPALAKALASS